MLKMRMTDTLLKLSRISAFLVLLAAFSCSDFIVGRNVRRMLGQEIAFPEECAGVACNGRPKMIFHYRPSDCSTCRIKFLGSYNELFSKFEDDVDFIAVFSTTDIGYGRVKNEIGNASISCSVYVDKGDKFDTLNDFLPDDSKYHIFLLDGDNRVVLVGDPMAGDRLLHLFEKKISEMK